MQTREFTDTLDASIAESILRLAGYDAVRNGATVMTDASEITLGRVEKIVVKNAAEVRYLIRNTVTVGIAENQNKSTEMKATKKYLHASRYCEETGTQISYIDAKTGEEHQWWTFTTPPAATNRRACEEFIGMALAPMPAD